PPGAAGLRHGGRLPPPAQASRPHHGVNCMSATIDPAVARAAERGARVGVLVLVEKQAHRGPAPLALDANLQTMGERAQEVCHEARALL
ncbi:hypothetical protein DQE80_15635, partial [Enterococcus sp. HPCN18]